MNKNSSVSFQWVSVCVLALLLSACAGNSGRPSTVSSVGPQVVAAEVNGQLIDEYYSASGKHCQRFSQSAQSQIMVRCRENGSDWKTAKSLDGIYTEGYLNLVQSTVNSEHNIVKVDESSLEAAKPSHDEPISYTAIDDSGAIPAEAGKSEISLQPPESIEFQVESGESLWSFSKRVTGSGNNWVAIAKANGLKNANHVWAGQKLLVPQSVR